MPADLHLLREPPSENDWSRGPADAPVTLVEYADFQCSHCQAAHPAIERMLTFFGDRVRFVFRHFPVVSTHPQAERAALAADAAGRQGRFWEMERRLFEARGALADRDLISYARELGLDTDRFRRDMDDQDLLAKIRRQKMVGLRSGVNGTPTIYLNGVRHDGPGLPAGEAALRGEVERLLRAREAGGRNE
ncbi:MAG: DsbA family protein [Armatimonadota bacterium]